MVEVTVDGEQYRARDVACPTLKCWEPGEYQHRGATLSGSRNTGDSHLCCLHREYHGCPTLTIEALALIRGGG